MYYWIQLQLSIISNGNGNGNGNDPLLSKYWTIQSLLEVKLS